MDDVMKTPYAPWLESIVQGVMELRPEKMAFCAMLPGGDAMTSYYGDCSPADMAVFSWHLQADAMMSVVQASANEILAAAEEDRILEEDTEEDSDEETEEDLDEETEEERTNGT